MIELLALPHQELQKLLKDAGFESYRAKQIMDYIYKRHVFRIDAMMQLPQRLRDWLQTHCTISLPKILEEKRTPNGDTLKLLLSLHDGSQVETVLMKQAYGNSVCVSSQVGCAMGCIFCASTRKGRYRNLEPYEIVAQVLLLASVVKEDIHSMVVMGAGEPMENYDAVVNALRFIHDADSFNMGYRRMTVSTCGLPEGIYRLAKEGIPITLALSLHASNEKIRQEIMPISRKYTLAEVLPAVQAYFQETGRKITFEYILIDGLNAGKEQAMELANLLRPFKACTINLIPVNGNEHIKLFKPNAKKIKEFVALLEKQGYTVVVRKEMGDAIQAACGQLKANYEKRQLT